MNLSPSIHMDNNLEFFKQRFKLEQATFSKIVHADAMVAVVYEVIQSSGEKLILKICPKDQHFFREVYFLRELKDAVPIPKVVEIVEPEQSTPGAILMEHLSGILLEKGKLTTQLAYEIGANLAQIHSITANGYGDLLYPSNLSSNPEDHWLEKLDESIEECRGHLSNDLTEKASTYVNDNIHLLKLADGPCIVHRDFRPGNIMIDQGKLNGIIDWASARAGFAQEDFQAFHLQEWSDSKDVNEAFIQGYKSVRAIPDYKTMMPLLHLSRAFATVGYTLKIGTWNGVHSKIYKKNIKYIDLIGSSSKKGAL